MTFFDYEDYLFTHLTERIWNSSVGESLDWDSTEDHVAVEELVEGILTEVEGLDLRYG